MVCIRCQKRPAIIFVQRMENGQMKNEGYCLHCAREMHIKPVDDLMKQFGMSDEDMDAMEDRMENMMQEMGDMSSMNPFSMMMGMGQPDQSEEDGDLVPGSSATFPLGVNGGAQNGKNEKKAGKNDKKPPRRKFLDTYCENLTRKAREGKLAPADMGCGSITISNLGMYDVDQFIAIVNPPESCILAVGSIRVEPVWDGSAFQPVHKMTVTGSFDHRIIDGAYGAQFLQELKALMESPTLMLY